MASQQRALVLYRNFFRAARQFQDFNLSSYVRRRVRENFHKHRHASAAEVPALLTEGEKELAVVQRQAVLSSVFSEGVSPNVVEDLSRLEKQR